MYTREETSRTKQSFWTGFGQYMKPVPSATGEKVNWPNYKTGIPHIWFRMQAERTWASVAIELTHPSAEIREQQYEQFVHLRNLLQEEWIWEKQVTDQDNRIISRIHAKLDGVNVLNPSDWPAIISFLKQHMITLDHFWNDVKAGFE
jgi:hypothetical protein